MVSGNSTHSHILVLGYLCLNSPKWDMTNVKIKILKEVWKLVKVLPKIILRLMAFGSAVQPKLI